MTEMERLQKEINGKTVVWHYPEFGLKFDSILLWPPNGTSISVKPYGLEPEEIYKKLKEEVGEDLSVTLGEIASPRFCLSEFRASSNPEDDWGGVVARLAALAEGQIISFEEIAPIGYWAGEDPSCPYGA